MPKIQELDPHVADLIAAGEVVERPASVVKELLENSIDAGAGIVTAEIAAGGMAFIRVTDNGCGIAPGEVSTAFLRHATSKLRDAGGLAAIGTLGFRGEALAAIAAVSRIELLTRRPGDGEGVSLSLEAGEAADMAPAGCPEGTTVIVRDLFFNTPARLKFMKSDRAESSGVASAALRCALSRPDVSVRLIRDGKTEFQTPGDSRADSCIYSLFGREFSAGLLGAESSDGPVAVSGFVSAPEAARGNRSYQFFFVNGRPIRSATLQAALEQAYANTLPRGRFPSCVLYITTRLCDVDVNVHPAKTEVKFVSDKQVFDGVYYAALGAASKSQAAGGWAVQGTATREPQGGAGAEAGAGAAAGTGAWVGARPAFAARGTGQAAGRASGSRSGFQSMGPDEYRKIYRPNGPMYGSQAIGEDRPSRQDKDAPGGNGPPFQDPGLPGAQPPSLLSPTAPEPFRVIGEALDTYIVLEYNNAVWFIDKHAAHERIHFDALKSGAYEPMSQALIEPVVCRLGHEGASALLENAALLDGLGFSVESFGEDSVAARRIPGDIDAGDAESALSGISAELTGGGEPGPAQRDAIYRTMACKAAIKAGRSSGMRELETLAARVVSGEVSHCPHGRPVAFEIAKATLDKGFKRI